MVSALMAVPGVMVVRPGSCRCGVLVVMAVLVVPGRRARPARAAVMPVMTGRVALPVVTAVPVVTVVTAPGFWVLEGPAVLAVWVALVVLVVTVWMVRGRPRPVVLVKTVVTAARAVRVVLVVRVGIPGGAGFCCSSVPMVLTVRVGLGVMAGRPELRVMAVPALMVMR